MNFKNGVYTEVTTFENGISKVISPSKAIIIAMQIADSISKKIAGKEIVITSILDGKHSRNSLHYKGEAFDIRVWIYTEKQIYTIVSELKKALGKDYDVVFEGDHIHIENDPK